MPVRVRKLLGAVALLALVTVWAFLAMGVAAMVLPNAGGLAAFLYYFIAGLGWVLPAMPIVSWMQRPDVAS